MAIGGIRIDTRIDTRISIRIGVVNGAPTKKRGITVPDIQKQPLLETITAQEVLA